MRKEYMRMSLLDTYKSVENNLENNKSELFKLLDEHLDWDDIIPDTFFNAFYRRYGRNRTYELESFLRALFLRRVFHYVEDSQLLNTLRFSYEMRDYCGFDKVPDASKLTRFKQGFCNHIRDVFERLVDLTEPIRREMTDWVLCATWNFLMKECRFSKVLIPFNPRRGLPSADIGFNENGTPLRPLDDTPLKPCGSANGKHRSPRLKYIRPKSMMLKTPNGRYSFRRQCDTPRTTAKYGRCVYVQQNKSLRLYPGISRDADEFAQIYNRRAAVERSINSLKGTLGISGRKTSNVLTTKADLFLAGIVHLLCVLLDHKLHDLSLARRPRKLIA